MGVNFRFLVSFLVIAALFLFGAWWVGSAYPEHMDDVEVETEPDIEAQCPKTLMTDQAYCFRCHTHPAFRLKESVVGEGKLMERYLRSDGERLYLLYKMGDIDPYILGELVEIRDYVSAHPGMIDRLVIDILSHGGSLFHAWDIVGLISEFKGLGVEVETRSRGFAASAAFLIFASGHKRITCPTAEFMWHELRSWVFFEEKSPSKLEDQARIYRHLQDTACDHLVRVSGGRLTKKFLDDGINKDELWLTGREMLEMGLADELIE